MIGFITAVERHYNFWFYALEDERWICIPSSSIGPGRYFTSFDNLIAYSRNHREPFFIEWNP